MASRRWPRWWASWRVIELEWRLHNNNLSAGLIAIHTISPAMAKATRRFSRPKEIFHEMRNK